MNLLNATLRPLKVYVGDDRISLTPRGVHKGLTKDQIEGAKKHPITAALLDMDALVISESDQVNLLPVKKYLINTKIPANLQPGNKRLAHAEVTKVETTVETVNIDHEVKTDGDPENAISSTVEHGKASKAKAASKGK